MSDENTVELRLTIVIPVDGNEVDFRPLIRAIEKVVADTYPDAVVQESTEQDDAG